jgi:dTDP-4-dehydrorhamnose reductase
VYGESKAVAEREVASILPSALIIRTSAFFGPWDRYNFVTTTLSTLRAGRTMRAAADTVVSPTYVPELVDAALDLLIDGERGIWHVANDAAVSWAELARMAARAARLDGALVEDCDTAALGCTAQRPRYSALGCERGPLLPPLELSLRRYLREYEAGD